MIDCSTSRAGGGVGLPLAGSPPSPRRRKPEDTATGCRAFAAADLGRAAAQSVDHGRSRFEHSAAAWMARADLLDRLDHQSKARIQAVSK